MKWLALVVVACVACSSGTNDMVPDEGSGGSGEHDGGGQDDEGDGGAVSHAGGTTASGGRGSGGETEDGSGGETMGTGGYVVGVGGAVENGTGGEAPSGGAPSETTPLSEMKLTARLDDNATCWKDDFPNAACKGIPNYEPPVIEWSCDETVAALVIPPGTCLRVSGRFAVTLEPACTIDPTASCDYNQPESSESKFTNSTTDEYRVRYIHRRRDCDLDWTAWWYAGECPALTE